MDLDITSIVVQQFIIHNTFWLIIMSTSNNVDNTISYYQFLDQCSLNDRLSNRWSVLLIIGKVYTKPQTEGTYFLQYRLVPSNRDHEYDTHRNQHNIGMVFRRDNTCGPSSKVLIQQMLTWEPSMYRYLLLFLQTTNVPSIKCIRCPDATVCRKHVILPCSP